MPFARILAFIVFLPVLAACSGGGGGLFNVKPPSGNYSLTLVGGSATALSSSPSAPVSVTGGFAVNVREDNYSDTFTAKIVSWTAPTTAPCYTVGTDAATVFTFAPVASPATNGSATSPCGGQDVEAVRFTDARGNATTLYFATGVTSTQTSSGTVVATLPGTTTPLASSLVTPVAVVSSFSISVQEAGYAGPFTATIISYTAPTTAPCYAVSSNNSTVQPTVFTFTPQNSPSSNGSTNACSQPGDVEGVRFADARGNSTTQYFTNGVASANASGIVIATLPGTATPLTSTLATPIAVTNSFSIALQEVGYSGPFTASIISYTAPTTAPCFTVSSNSSTIQPTVFTFTPQNSPSINGTTGACGLAGDIEGVLFSDSSGHSTIQYFASTPAPGSTSVTVNRIALSFIGTQPTNGVCGTYQLKVQAYDQNDVAITTAVTYTYPITVSIAGANNTAVITTTAPGPQSACNAPPAAATTLAIPTSSSPVYVFANGAQTNGTTTLTATAFGVPNANIGVLTF